MEDASLIRLNLQVGGRSFPVKVEKSEVDSLKKIEGQINEKINEFMVKYPGYDRIDIFSMSFMSVIFEMNKTSLDRNLPLFEKRLDDLAAMLDNSL